MSEDDLGRAGLERQNLRESMEKLKVDASGLLHCVGQWKGLLNHFAMAEANIEKRSQELDLKEKELKNQSSELDKKLQTFEEEKSKACDLKKLVEECTEEMRSKRNQLILRHESLTRVERQLELKDEQLKNVMAELKRRYNEARIVEDRKRKMEVEIERKKKELALISNQIEESSNKLEKSDDRYVHTYKKRNVSS